MKQAFDASETGLYQSLCNQHVKLATLSPTQAMKDENHAMLNAMRGSEGVKELACLQAQAKLIEALDHFKIEGIVRWKREPKTETKFDKKLAKELFEARIQRLVHASNNTAYLQYRI